jgi:transposase
MAKPRRTYTSEFKVRVVLEMLTSKKSLSQACREYGIKDSVVSRWRQVFLERAPQLFEQRKAEVNQAQRIAELERMVGRQALQLEMAKKVWGNSDFLLKGDE